jgi:hypothetical protein
MVALVAVSRALRRGPAKLALKVGMPLAALALFRIVNTDGSMAQMRRLLGGVLMLFSVLLGVFLIIRGIPGKRRSRAQLPAGASRFAPQA